jgi:hypothetical protein
MISLKKGVILREHWLVAGLFGLTIKKFAGVILTFPKKIAL